MQKKIIALAVAGLMSGAAFAQSNVVISGNLDAGANFTKVEGSSRATNAAYNNTSTSIIAFKATEDLGGGMKAGAYIETNPLGANVAATGVMGDFQRYVFINGGFGELSLGQRTNFSTTTATTAQPFGTALGGGYSGAAGRLRGAGYSATGALTTSLVGTRDVRAEGSVRYDSPNFNGFTFGATWKPQNNAGDTGGATSGHTNLGLNYAGGPLKVSYAYAKIKSDVGAGAAGATTYACGAGTTLVLTGGVPVCIDDAHVAAPVAATATAGAAGAAAYEQNIKHNMLAANYTIGAATIYGGYTTSKGNINAAATDVNSASWNLAVKYAVAGNIDLMANYLKDNDKTAVDANRKLFGLGADYKFSKRTAAYFRYENYDPSDKAANDKLKTYSVGLRHSF